MPHECGTSKPCQSAQTASSERAQCASGNGSSCRAYIYIYIYIYIYRYTSRFVYTKRKECSIS